MDSEESGHPLRLDFLDNARTLCMMLVVPYHAAHIYESKKDWWVHSPDNSAFFDLVIALQKSFCMSAFFLIAGFLSAMVIERKGLSPWARTRVPRLFLPFLASLLTIQLWQMHMIAQHEGAASAWQYWGDYLHERDRINIFHLWFIPCLIILSASFGIAVKCWGKKPFIWHRSYGASMAGVLGIAVAVFLVGRLVPPLLPFRMSIAWQIFDFRDALYYIAPFFLGAKLFWDKRFQACFLRLNLWTAIIGGIAYAGVLATLHADGFAEKAVRDLALPIAAICLSQFLIALCHRFLNASNRLSRALSESAYSIYLIHHPIVFWMGIEFLRVEMNIFAEYAIIVAAAVGIPYLIHRYCIAPSSILSLLFNGTPRPASGRAG